MAGIFDPKFIKDGNVTANLSFLATIKLPSLTSESSSLDFLSIAADSSIKKRSLGTMALLSAASFYDKITADGTFLKLTGGTLTGGLQVNSNLRLGFTNYLYTTANDYQTVIQTSRSDSTQYGFLSSNGWGDFLFSKGLAIGYTGISTALSYKLDVNGTARFIGNVSFGDYAIFGNNKFIDWNDTLGNPRRLLGLASNGFHVGDVDNTIANSVTNLWAKVQHNFFVNGDLKVQLVNGWNYFKGHIQAYGVLNSQVRADSTDGIAGKIQSVDGSGVYMGAESNHYLTLITNNVIRATLDTAGNFGIGTSTMNRKLTVYSNTNDVYSSFRTATSLQEGMLFGLGTNNQGVIYNSENTPIEFYTNRTLVGTVLANGYWGIGTNQPISKLTVQTIASASPIIALNINNPFGYGVGNGISAIGIRFNRSPNDSGLTGVMADILGGNENESSSTQGYLAFATRYGTSEATIERMRINSSGYVGIGLTNPLVKLNIGGGYGQLHGLAIGSLTPNEYATVLFTENYANGVTHLFSLKHTVGYGDLALAEYGGRVGIGTDRPNTKLDIRGTIRIGNSGFVSGSSGSFMDIWHANSTGNSQVNLQAWSNGGNTYDSIALQPLSGEVRIGTSVGGFKLNVGGNTRIDGYLRMGDNIGMENNKYLYWKDTTGTDRRFIGFSDGNTLFLGDIDRSVPNSNTVLISDTIWFYCGQANKAVITSSGLDVKGNYYQNGVLKTFFDGNYNSLSNLPNLGSYVLTSSIVQDELSINATNGNAVAAKVLFSMKDNIYANMNVGLSGKANVSHTHDWSTITGKPSLFDGNYDNLSNRPNLGSYVLTSSIVQDELSVNATNSNAVAAKVLFSMKDTIYANMNAGLSGKANASHTHDWNSITGKPSLFDGNYNNLSNRPTLFSGSYTDLSNKPVLFDGNYNNLSNKPTLFDGNYNSLINKPTLFDGNYNSLINKPTLFDGSYNSLSNLPNLNNFALAANTIPVTPYSGASSNPVSGLSTTENVRFWSMVRINTLFVSSSAYLEDSLSVAGYIWCDGGIRGTSLALSNPTTLLDYQVTKTNVEGVYVKVGNNVVKLTLTQFKNLMATV